MIFDKESTFPHPILSKFTDDYEDKIFVLKVGVQDGGDHYAFKIEYKLDSKFIINALNKNQANLYLLVQSKDSKFYKLENKNDQILPISKNRISLNKRTSFQLVIMTTEILSFKSNKDLHKFYLKERENIYIDKFGVLAISNVEKFNGDLKKPYELFEKKVDPNIKSEIKIEFGSETIIIVYRDVEYQYNKHRRKNSLNNHYVYMGLQRALLRFLRSNTEKDQEEIYINDIDEPVDKLDLKLLNLMKVKGVLLLNHENIDEVIAKISDKIISKHYYAIEETFNESKIA